MRAGRAAVFLALALAACNSGESFNGMDGGLPPDAKGAQDAAPSCAVHVSVSPPGPLAPVVLAATASVTGATSFVTLTWSVAGPDGDVDFQFLDTSKLRISFAAPVPGPYVVGVTAIDGGRTCFVDPATVNVGAAGANVATLRLRYTPPPGQGTPPQDDAAVVQVPGGADYALPARRVLVGGVSVAGTILGPAGALPSYLRLDATFAGTLDVYTDAAGRFAAAVPPTGFVALVVPYGALVAPKRFAVQLASDLSRGFLLDAGDAVSGTLLDGAGAPVAGARVALGAGTLPPIVVTTAGDGGFAGRLRAGEGPLALAAVTDIDRIDVAPALALQLAAGASVELRLSAAERVPVALTATSSGGAPLPGARVTLAAAEVAPGGTVRVNGGAATACAASARVVATAGDGGALPPLSLPRAKWTATVEPPLGSDDVIGTTSFDLTAAAPPAAVASAAPRPTRIGVRARGAAVAGATVIAVARGLHGAGAGATALGATDAGGDVVLRLVPGMTYDVIVDPPAGARLARARATLDGDTTASTVFVAPALLLTGTLVYPFGSGQAGVRVEAFCSAPCPAGQDPALPLAETVTGPGGAFALLVPDPGSG
jgi:hypothetical protein